MCTGGGNARQRAVMRIPWMNVRSSKGNVRSLGTNVWTDLLKTAQGRPPPSPEIRMMPMDLSFTTTQYDAVFRNPLHTFAIELHTFVRKLRT